MIVRPLFAFALLALLLPSVARAQPATPGAATTSDGATSDTPPAPGETPASARPLPAGLPAPASVAPSGETSATTTPSLLPLPPPRPAPIGRAAPPTEAATRGTASIRPGLEVFAQYKYQNVRAQDGSSAWFHAFDVPRVHAAIEGEASHLRGRVLVEATRSAAEGALIGVAGDSLVLRVREAYGAYRPIDALEISAGVIPTSTVPELDGTWMMRAVAPSALESSGFASPADLGARVRFDLPSRYGFVSAAGYNGEGYTSRELNRGKNFEGAVEVHPLPDGDLLPLGIFGSYVAGSSGTSLARADRMTAGLVWQGERVRAGAFVTFARGVAQLGSQNGRVMTAFIRAEPLRQLLVGARVDNTVRDTDGTPANALSTIIGSIGYRVADPLEAFLAFTRSIPTTRAESELPGTDAWDLSIVGRVVF